jgi:hypothetical protein
MISTSPPTVGAEHGWWISGTPRWNITVDININKTNSFESTLLFPLKWHSWALMHGLEVRTRNGLSSHQPRMSQISYTKLHVPHHVKEGSISTISCHEHAATCHVNHNLKSPFWCNFHSLSIPY